LRKLLILLSALTSALVMSLGFASIGFADPPGMLTDVPVHRHFVKTATGELVPVGPQICENPNLQQAFNEFHFNVHHSFIPGIGVIHTLGPQDGAPGLHNTTGAEIIAMPGCG
jgi:hypothetical protein